jgi:hypothetical protein
MLLLDALLFGRLLLLAQNTCLLLPFPQARLLFLGCKFCELIPYRMRMIGTT